MLKWILSSIVLCLFIASSCKDQDDASSGEDSVSFDRATMLSNLVTNIVVPKVSTFETNASALETAVTEYCATTSDATLLAAAQTKYKEALTTWQYLEVMQFGPLAKDSYTQRNKIYSWPLVNSCGVDREVTLASESGYTLTNTNNRIGLDAAEYLLFDTDQNHACTAEVTETATWNDLSESDRKIKRCTYLKLLTKDLVAQATNLKSSWSDTYQASFINGEGDNGLRGSVNAITDAMFYLDIEIKDMKIAIPAGISDKCSDTSCPESTEHPLSSMSLIALQQNMSAIQDLFLGGDKEGFDDYIKDLGREDIVTDMTAAISSFKDNLDKQQSSLESLATDIVQNNCTLTTTTDRRVEICALYKDAKAITDILKTEFLTVLDLEAPKRAEADND